jgi:hypothetical protein
MGEPIEIFYWVQRPVLNAKLSRPLGEAPRNENVRQRRWKAPGVLNLSSAERLANFKLWPLYR